MDETNLDEQLSNRLQILESGSAAEHLVDDLPVVDILVAVAALIVVTIGLLWWAY